MTKPGVAFLGTGIMGLPMCRHLLRAGFPVRVWNRTKAKAMPLESDGAIIAGSASAAVESADFIIVMLSSGPVVEETIFGEGEVSMPGTLLKVA
jgi:3-hydroxyisobutyrate dehydrogenase-like beta-hydroxyacid dehydrogenase